MATSAYILPHQPGAAATATPPASGADQLNLLSKLPTTKKTPEVGDTKIFYGTPEGRVTTLVSLGDKFASKNSNERRELVRRAVGNAVKEIRNLEGINHAEIDASTDPHAAGECLRLPYNHTVLSTPYLAVGAHLARYKFTLKTSPPSSFNPNLEQPIPESLALDPLQPSEEWDIGAKYAEAQNWARTVSILHRSVLTHSLTPS